MGTVVVADRSRPFRITPSPSIFPQKYSGVTCSAQGARRHALDTRDALPVDSDERAYLMH
jgi:hypothetical protein